MPLTTLDWNPRLFRSLQYFEAVARLGSVAAAADALGVSASAVSHQLRSLTTHVGEDLFVRSGRGLTLTNCGVRLQVQVAAAFSDLSSAVRDVVGERKQQLRIAVCSSFGPFWLAKRLPDFLERNPTLDVELRLYAHDPEQTERVADAVVTANPVAEGFESVTLFEEMLVAVGKDSGQLEGGASAGRLITTDIPPVPLGADWKNFWSQTGRNPKHVVPQHFLRCTHYLLALALAKSGLGCALVPEFVAEESLAAGDLLLLDPARVPSGRTYRLCYKVSRSKDPNLRTIMRWLKSDGASAI